MDEAGIKEEKEKFDPNGVLEDLMTTHKHYFTDERYKTPTSRYEAWLMASYLSNMKIARVLEDIFNELKTFLGELDIFQKQPENIKIKDEEKIPLKRRKN